MIFLKNIIMGVFIGAGAILPGISSGVFCVIFGIYEKLVNSIINFFKNIKKNILFLSPILLGCIIGIVVFGNVLKYLFSTFEIQTKFMTIGLILGCIPSVFKQANNNTNNKSSNNNFRLHYLIYSIISFLIALSLILIENTFEFTNQFTNSFSDNLNFYYLIFSGFCMSCGIIIPGISSTVILMCLGIYFPYIDAISTFNLSILLPISLGVFAGSIFFLYLIKYLFDKYYSQTFYCIIGFVFGSIFILFPNFIFNFNYIISSLLIILGFFISYNLSKKNNNN